MAGLRIERGREILRITLAKPERRNAFDAGLIAELHEAFSDVGDARVVVLAGDGPMIEVQATAERAPLSRDQLDELLDLAAGGIEEIGFAQRDAVEAIRAT